MAELEYGKGAVAFSSGMAAISSVILSFLESGDKIIVHKTLYGSTYSLETELLPKYNIGYKVVDLTNLENLEEAIDDRTKVVFFESQSNHDMSITQLAAYGKNGN